MMHRNHPTYSSNKTKQHGVALVVVLWMISIMLMIGGGLVYASKAEVEMTQYSRQAAQARAYADAALRYTIAQLLLPAKIREIKTTGSPFPWQFHGVKAEMSVIGENGLIDINQANRNLLREALRQNGVIDEAAETLLDAIEDFRDPDDLRRLNGAEDRDYADEGLLFGAKDAPIERIEELQQVMGMTPYLYRQLSQLFTVSSKSTGVNPMLASRRTLLVLAEGDAELVDDYIRRREETESAYLAPPFGQRYMSRSQQPNYRLQIKIMMDENLPPYFEERSIRLNPGKTPPFISYFRVMQKTDNGFLK
ncbi:MAG: general secretion pathway protein GspK [bacterium]